MKIFHEFKEFASRGTVIDLAVGVIIGASFGKIVTSLVNDLIMPPLGFVLGQVDFKDRYINLSGTPYASLAEAKAASAPVIAYGAFINTVIEFLIVAFAVFLLVRQINRLRQLTKRDEKEPESTVRECPECLSAIPRKAKRCSHCTAAVKPV